VTFDPASDRRPIAARRLRIIRQLAAALARRRIRPNHISLLGLAASLAAGTLLGLTSLPDHPQRLYFLLAAALIQLRLLCNLIDGLVAVEGNMRSPTGELFNEVPDRLSDSATLIGAGYAAHSSPALGYLAALAAVFVAYARSVGKGCGLPSDFRGPMAKQQRMFLITLCSLYLAIAPSSQPRLPAFLDSADPGLMTIFLAVIILGCIITAARRLLAAGRALNQRG
jgi:phosphatidylglycerophosphate synthase